MNQSAKEKDHVSCLRASLLGGEVVHEERALLALLAPVPDHDAGAIDDFAGVAFAVQYTCYSSRTRSQPQINSARPHKSSAQ